jgi:type VI secretion system protein ImpA
MRDTAGPEAAPSFEPLSTQLGKMARAVADQVALRPGHEDEATLGAGASVSGSSSGAIGTVKSRQDAIRALDAVAAFFRTTEPSSPIPLFVERAKRLVSKDFLEVLADVAPDALGQARAAGGIREGE